MGYSYSDFDWGNWGNSNFFTDSKTSLLHASNYNRLPGLRSNGSELENNSNNDHNESNSMVGDQGDLSNNTEAKNRRSSSSTSSSSNSSTTTGSHSKQLFPLTTMSKQSENKDNDHNNDNDNDNDATMGIRPENLKTPEIAVNDDEPMHGVVGHDDDDDDDGTGYRCHGRCVAIVELDGRKTSMRVKAVRRDGHCLFNAMLRQLNGCGHMFPNMATDYRTLRQQCVDWIRNHLDTVYEDLGTIKTLLLTSMDIANIRSIGQYYDRMSRGAEYGTFLEIIAVTQIYKVSVKFVENVDNIKSQCAGDRLAYNYIGDDTTGIGVYLYHTDVSNTRTNNQRFEHWDELMRHQVDRSVGEREFNCDNDEDVHAVLPLAISTLSDSNSSDDKNDDTVGERRSEEPHHAGSTQHKHLLSPKTDGDKDDDDDDATMEYSPPTDGGADNGAGDGHGGDGGNEDSKQSHETVSPSASNAENREGKSNSTAGDFEEKLFELVAGVENENKQDSTVAMKKLWALIGRNPSTDRIESVIATNVVKRVIECLKMCDGDRSTTSAKILEVITVCSNLNQIEYVVEAGALPVFVNILWRPISNDSIDHKPIIVAVGTIALASSACRNMVLKAGVMAPLLSQIVRMQKQDPPPQEMLILYITLCSALCYDQDEEQLPTIQIRELLSVVVDVFSSSKDVEVLGSACEALVNLTCRSDEHIRFVIKQNGCKRLVELLSNNTSSDVLMKEAINMVASIVTYIDNCDDLQNQFIDNNNIFHPLSVLLSSSTSSNVVIENICRVLSNILYIDNETIIQAILDDGIIFPRLIALLSSSESDIAKEAATTILDITSRSTITQLETLAKQRVAHLSMFVFTPQEQVAIDNALSNHGSNDASIPQFVKRSSMHRLQPEGFLNDEIVNNMFDLLSERDHTLCSGLKNKVRSHFFNTNFATQLLNKVHTSDDEYVYGDVKSWSLKVPGGDIFELDKVFIPINIVRKHHWILAVIFMKKQRIEIFDSLDGDGGKKYLQGILEYLKDDYLDKRGTHLPNAKDWKLVPNASKTPRQTNGYDCGLFTLFFADLLSMDLPLVFNQNDIGQLRNFIALSIIKENLIA